MSVKNDILAYGYIGNCKKSDAVDGVLNHYYGNINITANNKSNNENKYGTSRRYYYYFDYYFLSIALSLSLVLSVS